jgi:hypothetical protein
VGIISSVLMRARLAHLSKETFLDIYYLRIVDNSGEIFTAFEIKTRKKHEYLSKSCGRPEWPIAKRFYNKEMKMVLEYVC